MTPVSYAQQRLWFLHKLEGPSATYNIPIRLRLTGQLDLAALEQALHDVVERHESLRTVFGEADDQPVQIVRSPEQARIPLAKQAATAQTLPELVAQAAAAPFDLASQLPVRAWLFAMAADEHVLLLVLHHIACDGWSMEPLSRDLGRAYTARLDGREPGWEPLPVQYADYTLWQRQLLGSADDPGSVLRTQLDYWTRSLAGLPAELSLPADRPRPAVTSLSGATVPLRIPADVHASLVRTARDGKATLFMVVQAALAALLSRLGAGPDIPIGSAVSGRTDQALEDMVGFFVNTVVLRADVSGNPTFRELLARVRAADLAALAHQDLPFDRLVEELNPERVSGRQPLFQVGLAFEDMSDLPLEFPGLTVRSEPVSLNIAKVDLTVFIPERYTGGAPAGIDGWIEYSTELFDAGTVQALADRLCRMLSAVAADPGQRPAAIDILGEAERAAVLLASAGPGGNVPPGSLAERFEAMVRARPDAPAVRSGQARLSYAELNSQANRLAHRLLAAGLAAEQAVGVLLERSPAAIVATLAVIKAGGCYVPLSPGFPPARLAAMMAETGAGLLLVSRETMEHGLVGLLRSGGITVIAADGDASLAGQPDADPGLRIEPDRVAYVIYTSGSTGAPKGAAVTHGGVSAYAADRRWPPAGEQRVPMHSPYAFDASTGEIWLPLLRGDEIVVAPAGSTDPRGLGALIRDSGVTVALFTPALLNLMVDECPEDLAGLRLVWTGGDLVPPLAVRSVLERNPRAAVAAVYGTTETTVIDTWQHIGGAAEVTGSIPIGLPMDNSRVYVLDAGLQLAPAGVVGELYIGGAGVARGYAGRPDLTATRFVPDPYAGPGSRMYRTGDLGRRTAAGVLEFAGRADDQVKIRGFRIELGEIESVLRADPAVRHAAVLMREDQPGDKRLVAYLVPADGDFSAAAVLARAADELPDYMLPAATVVLDALPLTPNGKVDRRRLLPPENSQPTCGRRPRTAAEQTLCELFAEVLGVPAVNVDDDFFDLGGHSLLAARLVSRVRSAFNAEVELAVLFDAPTVAEFAEAVTSAGPARPALRPRS